MNDVIGKIKSLMTTATQLFMFHSAFQHKYSDKSRFDKQGYGFEYHQSSGSAMPAFSLPSVSFRAYVGEYGRSSVSTALYMNDLTEKDTRDAFEAAFIHALNQNQVKIFTDMHDYMKDKAMKLKDKAQAEVTAQQKLLESLG